MGQYDLSNNGHIYLVESVQDVYKLKIRHPDQLRFVTQTTLSMDDTSKVIDALRATFPAIEGPRKDDICYATQNRQDAVKNLTTTCDLILVVGSKNSSNSNRLKEIATYHQIEGYLIDGAENIQLSWLKNKNCIGVTAGASAPELLVQQVIDYLRANGAKNVTSKGFSENVTFMLPKELR